MCEFTDLLNQAEYEEAWEYAADQEIEISVIAKALKTQATDEILEFIEEGIDQGFLTEGEKGVDAFDVLDTLSDIEDADEMVEAFVAAFGAGELKIAEKFSTMDEVINSINVGQRGQAISQLYRVDLSITDLIRELVEREMVEEIGIMVERAINEGILVEGAPST